MRGGIFSPRLATTLLYNLSRRWSLYLNRCVAASVSEALEAPGGGASPFRSIPSWLSWIGGSTLAPSSPFGLQTWCLEAKGEATASERKTG